MRVTIQNNDQAIAAVPHLLGFEPQESLVVVPVAGSAPVARIDLPHSAAEAQEMIASLADTYDSTRWGDSAALIVCFSKTPEATEDLSRHLQIALENHGVAVVRRLGASDDAWHDFTERTVGARTDEARSFIGAEAAFAGRRTPAPSREALAAEFVGNAELIAEVLDTARRERDASTRQLERRYCQAVADQYRTTGQRLELGDAARLLVNMEDDLGLFLDFASEIRTTNAAEWLPLWKDLTKHAPEAVRVQPACLAAIGAWCAGDGASAWSALDRIPAQIEASHLLAPMAELLRASLRTAAHPRTWDRLCSQAFESAQSAPDAQEEDVVLDPAIPNPGHHRDTAGPTF